MRAKITSTMDFLDPKRRKAHRRRLFIGYVLMAVIVAIGTMTVLYLAYGYDVNRQSGQLIQNGIVFVDSKPNNAVIYVNGVPERSRTSTRLVLPAGTYNVRIEAPNYRHWERTFDLEGGEIERLVYPFLLPNSLTISDVQTYDATPQLATQSPDRRWLLVQHPGQIYQFDVFDLNQPEKSAQQIAVPMSVVTNPAMSASLEAVEWSTNNRHVLLKRTYGDKSEYIMFDRENPGESVNLNSSLGISPAKVTLRDKRPDRFYYLDAQPGVLRSADTKARTISAPLVSGVVEYQTYGSDIVFFVTHEGAESGKADFKILDGTSLYNLKSMTRSDRYVIDVSRYEGGWYYVAGSAADNLTFVYKNPLSSLNKSTPTPVNVAAIMRLDNPRFVSFSANTQFIGVQSGDKLLTVDLEDGHQYRTDLAQDIGIEQKLVWMDGHRYYYAVNNQSYIVDFDGSNAQTLVTTRLLNGPFFDRDYDNVFTVEGSKTNGSKAALTMTIIDNR